MCSDMAGVRGADAPRYYYQTRKKAIRDVTCRGAMEPPAMSVCEIIIISHSAGNRF